MILLAELRRLPEHRAVLGRISVLGRRDRRVCRSEEKSGSAGQPIREDAGSTGRLNTRSADGRVFGGFRRPEPASATIVNWIAF